MKVNISAATVVVATLTSFAGSAQAVLLMGPGYITPSSTEPTTRWIRGLTIDEIADNYTFDSHENGFASDSAMGTITLKLSKAYDLTEFRLWNDIYVRAEGIKDFRLDFFDKNNSLITRSAIFQGPLGQVDPEFYSFETVPCVWSVNLEVLNSHEDIEIREVAFVGEPCPEIPEPPIVEGDLNDDNVVDAADYVVWRKYNGQNVTLPNDPTPGTVTAADYEVWRAEFGNEFMGGGVPEPHGITMALAGTIALINAYRRRRPAPRK